MKDFPIIDNSKIKKCVGAALVPALLKTGDNFMKKTLIFMSIIGIIFIAIFTGNFIFRSINKEDSTMYEAKQIEDECTIEGELLELGMLDGYVRANSNEEKVGPNTILKLKKIYLNCAHTITEQVEIPKELINMNKNELIEEYNDWKLEEFSSEEIIFSREYTGICNEHYLIKITGDVLGIYTIDQTGKETLKEKTEIYVDYLPENDVSRLKEGIEVIGKENLNSLLEDYE